MLLVLKDLWTGDLAIGGEKNIGRGVFKGSSVIISFNGKNLVNGQIDENNTELQQYVDSLINQLGVAA